ncbi:hypothetical protein NDU88_001442 [Pleurodeles waltl]|uniref:Uncharacterized protein n=1 Tax=Pleurodeles waltl TaxID=8319 RepID=A0AAV7KTF7_PLEWA|nr:hypothetical protein NDU88_001442 [Pleurodeles waltl]
MLVKVRASSGQPPEGRAGSGATCLLLGDYIPAILDYIDSAQGDEQLSTSWGTSGLGDMENYEKELLDYDEEGILEEGEILDDVTNVPGGLKKSWSAGDSRQRKNKDVAKQNDGALVGEVSSPLIEDDMPPRLPLKEGDIVNAYGKRQFKVKNTITAPQQVVITHISDTDEDIGDIDEDDEDSDAWGSLSQASPHKKPKLESSTPFSAKLILDSEDAEQEKAFGDTKKSYLRKPPLPSLITGGGRRQPHRTRCRPSAETGLRRLGTHRVCQSGPHSIRTMIISDRAGDKAGM